MPDLQQEAIPIPDEVSEQLRLLAALTGVDEQEHLRRAVRGYLESSGREAEVTAFADRARERVRSVLDRLGDL
ncbi:MAG: CopG family transcriptional regulator [Actinomycetota bacterium]|nr:CopG family transcriptional regulator [Actinomycetota bacterium]MDH5224397.1 CopG family transcriptional regulator [Actinomycetota bacterium]MDH5313647.1 CopG family transcriptional regulator [Actinomycetota bacterium]